MNKIVRMISADGSVMACAVDSTEIVSEIEHLHKTSAVVTAAAGRLATGAVIMSAMLKNKEDSITLKINGGGPIGTMIAVANGAGNVKAFAENPVVEIPLSPIGKLDVGTAVGQDGTLCVVKDVGLAKAHTGQVQLVSGEIAEDITKYYAQSEQTPTVCSLGVLVNPDLTVSCAGGFLVQLLPFADETCIDTIEENIKTMPPISKAIGDKMTAKDICNHLLSGLNPNILDELDASYQCDCSKPRVEKAIISMGKSDLQSLIDDAQPIEVNCQFCDKKYVFAQSDLQKLLNQNK